MYFDKTEKIILFTILASLSFFNPLNLFAGQIGKLIYFLLWVYCFFITFRNEDNMDRENFPNRIYLLLISSVCVSIIPASLFHDQSWIESIITTLPFILGYSFLFILIKSAIPPENMERIIIVIGVLSAMVLIINNLTAPNYLFGEQTTDVETRAGITRVRTPFMYLFYLFFFSVGNYKENNSIKNLSFVVITYLLIFLTLSRQYMVYSLAFGLYYYINRVSWVKKFFIIAIVGVLFSFVLQNEHVTELINISKEQADSNQSEDDVRLVAYEMYINGFQENEITRVIGNGVPSEGKSNWGRYYENITNLYHTYSSDVGWGGFYFHFGIFATFALVFLIVYTCSKANSQSSKPALYSLICMALFAFAGGTILYYDEIITLMIYTYLIYAFNNSEEECFQREYA